MRFSFVASFRLGIKNYLQAAKIQLSPLRTYSVTCKDKLNVTFFGTDIFSLTILNGLYDLYRNNLIKSLNVVTCEMPSNTDAKNSKHEKGYFSKENRIVKFCQANRLQYFLWMDLKRDKSYLQSLRDNDIAVIASFGHIIPSKLIELYPYGFVNVHPSLLPRWRGASPVVFSVLFDDKETGVTLMKILPKHFDVGPIIEQRRVKMPPKVTSLQLLDYLSNIGIDMIKRFFTNFESSINSNQTQSNENVTYAHKVTSQMFFVNWSEQTCNQVESQYRGLHEISLLKSLLLGKVVKFFEFVALEQNMANALDANKPPGYTCYLKMEKIVAIKCKDGYVGFRGIVYKKKMSALDFYNGYIKKVDELVFESVDNTIMENIHLARVKKIESS